MATQNTYTCENCNREYTLSGDNAPMSPERAEKIVSDMEEYLAGYFRHLERTPPPNYALGDMLAAMTLVGNTGTNAREAAAVYLMAQYRGKTAECEENGPVVLCSDAAEALVLVSSNTVTTLSK